MTNKLIPVFSLLALALLVTTACNDDVDTSPWLPNYTDSGYGGRASAGGGGSPAASGAGGGAADSAGSAGEAGAP